jgi:hypothetical protein
MGKTNPLNIRFKENIIIRDIENYLKFNFGIDIIQNKKIIGGSSRRRPDVLIQLDTHNIIVEIDERQHHRYNYLDDKKRIQELHDDLNQIKPLPLIIIKFNPDRYIDNEFKNHKSVFNKDRKTRIYKIGYIKQYNLRIDKLKETIIQYYYNVPINSKITIYKLFFNMYKLE